MAFKEAILTRQGLSLQAKLDTGGVKLNVIRAVSSDDVVDTALLPQQTVIKNPIQTLVLGERRAENNQTILPVTLYNEGVVAPYTLRQIGVYAEDPDIGEILYLIAQDTDSPDTIPTEERIPNYRISFEFSVFALNAEDKVVVNIDKAGAVPRREFDAYKQELIEDNQGFGRVYFKRRSDAWTGDVHAYFWSSVILNPAWDWFKSPSMRRDEDGVFYIERPGDYEQLIFLHGFQLGQPKTSDLSIPPKSLCKVPMFIQHPYGDDGHWIDKSSMTQRLLIKGPHVAVDFSEQNLMVHYRKWSDHERTSMPAIPLGVAGYYYADVPVGTDDFYLSLSNAGETVLSSMVLCSSNVHSFPLYNATWVNKKNIIDEDQYFTNYEGNLHFQLPQDWRYADVVFADGRTVVADCIDHYNRIYRVPASRYDESTYETVYDDFKVRYQDKETSMTQQLHPNPGRKIYNVQTGAWIDYPVTGCSKYFTISVENLYESKNSEYLAAWDTVEHKRTINAIAQAVSASAAAGQVRVDLLAQIGSLANLRTVSKNNLVEAINELKSRQMWTVEMTSEEISSYKIYPNRLYVWRTARSTIEITELLKNAGDTATTLNEYRIQFTAGSDFAFSFPSAVRWQGGVTPAFTSGATYQVSILNNIARVM